MLSSLVLGIGLGLESSAGPCRGKPLILNGLWKLWGHPLASRCHPLASRCQKGERCPPTEVGYITCHRSVYSRRFLIAKVSEVIRTSHPSGSRTWRPCSAPWHQPVPHKILGAARWPSFWSSEHVVRTAVPPDPTELTAQANDTNDGAPWLPVRVLGSYHTPYELTTARRNLNETGARHRTVAAA